MLLPVEQFRAGSTRQHLHAWEEWLGDNVESRDALNAIQEGVRFDLVEPLGPCQRAKPGFQKRFDQVHQMLVRRFGSEQADRMITGNCPHPARFPNKRSVQDYWEFVEKEVSSLVASGAWTTWQNAGGILGWAMLVGMSEPQVSSGG